MTVKEQNKIWMLLFDGRVYELDVDQITSWNENFVPTLENQEENKDYDEPVKNYIKNSKQF